MIEFFAILLLLQPPQISPDQFVGTFSHSFTGSPNEPVMTIEKVGASFSARLHADGSVTSMNVISSSELKAFWEQMWWPLDSIDRAACLTDNHRKICYAPPEVRSSIDELGQSRSNYFMYTPELGVLEMQKIP
jgi:hypothetical protein